MPTPLVELLRRPDAAALAELLAPDARFHSPVADYGGREDVAHLLTIVPAVLRDVRASRVLAGEAETATFVTGTVADRPAEAVVDERYDADGRLAEITLMVRPLAALRRAVAAMGEALAADPLPSAR